MKLAVVLAVVFAACAGEVAAPVTPKNNEPAAAAAADNYPTAPLPLSAVTRATQEAKAIGRANAQQRITRGKAFLKNHPRHHKVPTIAKLTIEALLEVRPDGFADDIASAIRAVLSAHPTRYVGALNLISQHYLRHELPAKDVLPLFTTIIKRLKDQASRTRAIAQTDWQRDKHKRTHQSRLYKVYVYKAWLELRAGALIDAQQSLANAENALPRKDVSIKLHSANGELPLAPEDFDTFYVVAAALRIEQKQPAAARRFLAQIVGEPDSIPTQQLLASIRENLAIVPTTGTWVHSKAPLANDFTLTGLNKTRAQLSKFRGKVVILTFWATWCGPCKKEMPELAAFAKANPGVVVLAINTEGVGEKAAVAKFIKDNNLSLKVLFAEDKKLLDYSYRSIPSLYVIDRFGHIAIKRTGYDVDLKAKLQQEVKPLLSATAPLGPKLINVMRAPQGFGVLWKKRLRKRADSFFASNGEIAVLQGRQLLRIDATGKDKPSKRLTTWFHRGQYVDLDGNGTKELLLASRYGRSAVLDKDANLVWQSNLGRAVGAADVNGDNKKEIIVAAANEIKWLDTSGALIHRSPPIRDVDEVIVGKNIGVFSEGKLYPYRSGKLGQPTPLGPGTSFRPPTQHNGVETLVIDRSARPLGVILGHDFDGDGIHDVLRSGHNYISVHSKGKEVIRLRTDDSLAVIAADLNNDKVSELIVSVDGYGLVVFSRASTSVQ